MNCFGGTALEKGLVGLTQECALLTPSPETAGAREEEEKAIGKKSQGETGR